MEETVGNLIVDDAQVRNEQERMPEDYYRSQQEVDEAFKKRLAAERAKWEKEAANAQPSLEEETGEERPDAGEMTPLEQRRFMEGVLRAEEEIKREDPYFDMEEEFKRNPMFAMMVANGYDAKRVYEFFYPIRYRGNLKKTVEREVLDRIRLRNNRPQTISAANAALSVRDISRMSDEEIRAIDARIKRGEKVRI